MNEKKETIRRYFLIQTKFFSFKLIMSLSFLLPALLSMMLMFYGKTSLVHINDHLVQDLHHAGILEPILWFYWNFIKLATFISDSKDSSFNMIFGFLLSGVFIYLFLSHLISLLFELNVRATLKEKNMPEWEVENFVYFKMFKKNINEADNI